jgi:flagellar hook assembly protein FlgD
MGKRLLSLLLLGAMALTASVGTFVPSEAEASEPKVFGNLSLDKTVFNPDVDDNLVISFDVLRNFNSGDERVYVELFDNEAYEYVSVIFSSPLTAGHKRVFWNGGIGSGSDFRKVLDGRYSIVLSAKAQSRNFLEFEYKNFTVERTQAPAFPAPQVLKLTATPDTFSARDGESTSIEFSVNQTAQLTLTIQNENRSTLKTFSSFAGNTYSAYTLQTQTWDGKSNAGAVLPEGRYRLVLNASNANGQTVEERFIFIKDADTPVVVAPSINTFHVNPSSFKPQTGQTTQFSFSANQNSYFRLTVENSAGTVVRTFPNYSGTSLDSANSLRTQIWDGKNNAGTVLPEGQYRAVLTASNSNGSTTRNLSVSIQPADPVVVAPTINTFHVNPSSFKPQTGQTTQFSFSANQNSYFRLTVENSAGTVVRTFPNYSGTSLDSANSLRTQIWDGKNNAGTVLPEGQYRAVLTASNSNGSTTRNLSVLIQPTDPPVVVAPKIVSFAVNPFGFSPRNGETTEFAFSVDQNSYLNLSVENMNGNVIRNFSTFSGNNLYNRNRTYRQVWDGKSNSGAVVSENSYRVVLTASNSNGTVTEKRFVLVKDAGTEDPSAPQFTTFSVSPRNFSPSRNETTTISFRADSTAFLQVLVVNSAGSVVKTFSGYGGNTSYSANQLHSLRWDGKNMHTGRPLADGVYTVVGGAVSTTGVGSSTKRLTVTLDGGFPHFDPDGRCGGYPDTRHLTGELCEAIQWVTDRGIFDGHDTDGTFRPFTGINRAETLKVTFLAFPQVPILPATGSNFGFHDVTPYAWYAPYVRTGKFYGMLHGYLNSTKMKPNQVINRVEFLKFMLEAMNAFTDFKVPGYERSYFVDVHPDRPTHDWFFDYAGFAYEYGLYNTPGNRLNRGADVQRGEVALLMYRMFKHGLLQ